MNSQTDLEIIDIVRAGNTGAYAILVNRYSNRVFTLAYQIILNREEAEEIAQDAFVKAFTALHSFKELAQFSTWLYRIVVNTALNKKKLKKQTIVELSDAEAEEEYEYIHPMLHPLENKEQQQFLVQALSSLQEAERICITMYYLNELSVNEIHELTDLTVANIKVLLHRGRKHLYNKLSALLKSEIKNWK